MQKQTSSLSMSLFGNQKRRPTSTNPGQLSMVISSSLSDTDNQFNTNIQSKKKPQRRDSNVSVGAEQIGRGRRSSSGSILEPQNHEFLKDLIKDDNQDEFLKLFTEGLQDVNHPSQDKLFNQKQVIFVCGKQFEFSQYDPIFSLKQSQIPLPSNVSSETKKKKLKVQPLINQECFCCSKMLSKNVKQDQCHFCTKQGCADCVYKGYPFPKRDGANKLRGRICRVCETKFYIKAKLVEIFTSIDKKEIRAEKFVEDVIIQQQKHNELRLEFEQLKIIKLNNMQIQASKVDQINTKIIDMKENVEKQEKENKRLAAKISLKEEEFQQKIQKIKQLEDQIESTKRNLMNAHDELKAKQTDREFIRNYLRQLNPNKKQPSQRSFNKKDNFKISESLVTSQVEQQNEQAIDTLQRHLSKNQISTRESGNAFTPKLKSIKRHNPSFQKESCCPSESCLIF